jgi:serine/threonine-protein kinase
VLPFANMSADPENEYFADGITEEIINALTQFQDLRVVARTSAFAFKGKNEDLRTVGEKLNVSKVLEGSVRKAGNRLRITAQLVNAADGYHLWSERYDREMDDVFAIQDDIATTIADRLKVTLAGETEPLVKPPTENLQAYQLYLKGRYLWNKRTKDGLEQAVEYLRQAIERDPAYALAYAGLADAYLLLGSYAYMPGVEALSKAKASAERALELDETLAEAHTSRGQVLRAGRDRRGEEEEYRRAIELNPSYATAHQWYATLLAALGRSEEALREIRRAEELDPLSHAISVTVAVVLFLGREYDAAMEQLGKTLELEPDYYSLHRMFGVLYVEAGLYEEAIGAVQRAIELNPEDPDLLVDLGCAYARSGKREKANVILEQAKQRGADAGWIAALYTALGDLDRAFEWLERGLQESESRQSLFYLKVFPWYDPLGSDPRFENLLLRMDLLE